MSSGWRNLTRSPDKRGAAYNVVMSEASPAHFALVTGGAHRVGRILVEGVVAAGAGVAVHYGVSRQPARELVEELKRDGGRAAALGADLADPDAAAGLVEAAQAALGPIDWLVNSASVFDPLELETTDAAAWDRHFAVNLRAPFLLAQAFARARGGLPGSIVNILDWRALRPGADHLPYTIAKAGLAAFTRSLGIALAPSIRVNGLALGAILPPADGGTEALRGVPLGRWAKAEEVRSALRFLLAGPEFLTGAILHLDGGRHLVQAR